MSVFIYVGLLCIYAALFVPYHFRFVLEILGQIGVDEFGIKNKVQSS